MEISDDEDEAAAGWSPGRRQRSQSFPDQVILRATDLLFLLQTSSVRLCSILNLCTALHTQRYESFSDMMIVCAFAISCSTSSFCAKSFICKALHSMQLMPLHTSLVPAMLDSAA